MGRPGVHAIRAMLRDPDFRRLFRVRLAGQAGDGLFQGALFGATFFNPQKATSAAEAAPALATLLLPYSFVGPFAGVLLDRWSRQRVLAVANGARATLMLLLAVSMAARGPVDPVSVTLALFVVSLNRFVLSGLSAALPQVVEARYLVTANSLTTTLGTGAAAVGGFASVGLRELWGKGDTGAAEIAAVAALAYLLAGGLAGRIARRRLGPTDVVAPQPLSHALGTVTRGLVAGARHVHARRQASRALLAITAHRFFSGLLFVSTLLLYTAQGYVHRGFAGLGQVLTATVTGGLAAAAVTPRITRRLGTQRWIVCVLAGAAVVAAALVAPYTPLSLLLAGLGLGFTAQAAKICVDTLVQESVEDAFRGRVFSFYDTLFNVSFVGAAAFASVIVPNNGRSNAVLVLIVVGYAVTSLLYGAFVRLRAPSEPPEPVIART